MQLSFLEEGKCLRSIRCAPSTDGFQSGDFAAALRPLEESVDLRPAEMPRLEKSSQAAFKRAIQAPETALFWTEASFHPNVSVRRFARKLVLGLKNEAQPLGKPLRERITRFLHEERLRSWATDAREAAARRDQTDILQNAVELLLRADVDEWMTVFAQLLDRVQPISNYHSEEQKALRQKWHQAQLAIGEKTNELYAAEWGEEMRDPQKRASLPSRARREISEKVQELPEVKALMEGVPANPWVSDIQSEAAIETMHWMQVRQIFNVGALSDYIGYNASQSEASQEIARRVRVHLWNWIEAALLQVDEKAACAHRAWSDCLVSIQWHWLEAARKSGSARRDCCCESQSRTSAATRKSKFAGIVTPSNAPESCNGLDWRCRWAYARLAANVLQLERRVCAHRPN